jgi:hypothetical protein
MIATAVNAGSSTFRHVDVLHEALPVRCQCTALINFACVLPVVVPQRSALSLMACVVC